MKPYKKKQTVKRKKWGGSRLPDGPRITALIRSNQYYLVPEFMRRAARQADAADAAAAAAAAAASRDAAAASQRIVRRTGALRGNDEYNPTGMPAPQFTVSRNVLKLDSHYSDLIDGEDKNVVDALNGDPYTLAFKIHHSFYVITKGKLFELMNNPVSIKYECDKIRDFGTHGLKGISDSVMKAVPYLSIGSFSQIQGLVSFSHLWHIIFSQQPSQAFELVETHRPPMLSIASHNFLFGPGSAGERAVSAAHCQAGQDASSVYEIRILPIERRRSHSGSRSHSRSHSRSRSRAHRAATTIQRLIRSRRSRKKATNRDS